MRSAIVHDPGLNYPSGEDWFSPDTAWPEYRMGHLSGKPNPVYAAVRSCFAAAGLDRARFGSDQWNPLREYIAPGTNVFLLCNFVEQKVRNNGDAAFFAKCTHGSVIRPVIDYVLLALDNQGSVAFGNAPLQSCRWSDVTQQSGAQIVEEFYSHQRAQRISVSLLDLRQHIIRRRPTGTIETALHVSSGQDCVEIDLGASSLLEHHYDGGRQPRFRVLDYDPRGTERCHARGRHTYTVHRRIIESDTVISIPKLKTHEKVGITCGIKGCVGAVAHKDCLAHHRFGAPRDGGDEFPDRLAALTAVSHLHERAYTGQPGWRTSAMHSANYMSRKVVRRFTRAFGGSWPGNDTCWRMAVDLARIVKYADQSGQLQERPQRHHLVLTDGITGGEGEGPLSPDPVPLGYLSFCDDVVIADYVNALAMGFDPVKIPMIREAMNLVNHRLTDNDPCHMAVPLNGRPVPLTVLRGGLGKRFVPAREWRRAI